MSQRIYINAVRNSVYSSGFYLRKLLCRRVYPWNSHMQHCIPLPTSTHAQPPALPPTHLQLPLELKNCLCLISNVAPKTGWNTAWKVARNISTTLSQQWRNARRDIYLLIRCATRHKKYAFLNYNYCMTLYEIISFLGFLLRVFLGFL